MDEVIRTRLKLISESVQSQLNSAQSLLQCALNSDVNIEDLELIRTKLESINLLFTSEIHNYCKSVAEPNIDLIKEYTLTQIQAEELVSELQVTLKQNDRNRNTASTCDESINISSKLPRIELTKFDGDILKWYPFWDQFVSNIDKRNISDVDKLLYLQSVLEGDAKQAIVGLDITNKNYSIAVNTLKERYGKPSAIIDAHYVALYRIKAVTSNQVKDCRNVLGEIEKHLRVLSSLGEDVNHNHLRVMIMEKFPEDLIYELRMKMIGEDDSIDSIRKKLEYIISARETSNRLRNDSSIVKNTETTTIESNSSSDNFTLGSLHVKSEEVRSNRHRKFTTFNRDKTNFGTKKFNNYKLPTRKRPYDNFHKTDEPPAKTSVRCVFCHLDHFNDECPVYKTIQERKSQLGNRCFNCFGVGHRASNCRSSRKCKHCSKFGKHNRALCPTKFLEPVKLLETNNLHIRTRFCTTILQTCLIKISSTDNESNHLQCRILLDCGSQRSYITETIAKSLNLSIVENINLSIFTFGAKSPHQIESPVVKFKITTRTGIVRLLHANVVPHITHNIQTPVFDEVDKICNGSKYKNIVMADDGSCGDRVDILIGNDYYHSFMSHEKILVTQYLYLINSDFGWVWSGKINESFDKSCELSVLTYFQSSVHIDNKLNEPDLPLKLNDVKMLWDLESIGITDSPKTSREEEALKKFNETVQLRNNRYYVQWPWVETPPNLSNNFGLAFGRLGGLIKRLDSSEIKEYDQIIQEQLQNNIIEVVQEPNVSQIYPVHYLPHHCVRSRGKPNKLRIVYDASAKIKNNRSLNECLYRGPLMLEDLTGLLIKFREHPIGIIADVEKAFLQLGLQESDRDVTRFLWLKNIHDGVHSNNILHLRFCRVPFGVISSPFLLNASIRFHLLKSDNVYIKQIAEDIYVDNIVTGTQTISEALELFKTSRYLFENISMNLREWTSNSKELLSQIPVKLQTITHDGHIKVLGLAWYIENDYLSLKYSFDYNDLETVQSKRDVLKTIASIYDPCGLAVPVMLPAKLFFQGLWKIKTTWDSKLNDNLLIEWRKIIAKFHYLKEIQVDRYFARNLNEISNRIQYEIHCFTDASLTAYSAVVYLRCTLDANNIVSFVIGKSRLVPLKEQQSLQIPKLELLGVLIGCRLIKYVLSFLRLKVYAQYLWTDSQIVLSWYRSEKLLPPFVLRRITEIKQNKTLQLRFVSSQTNPADIGTRAERVDSYDRWLKGPDFLLEDPKQWPRDISDTIQIQTNFAGEGLTNTKLTSTENISEVRDSESVRIHDPEQPISSESEKIRNIQNEYFPKEVLGIVTDLARSLKLYKDQDGVIRCRGRFKYTDFTDNQKEPILLPKKSDFTHKIIKELHEKNYHVGVSHTLALLRQNFWVPHGRATVQKIIRRCPQCIKYGGGPFKLPPMPDLPKERVKLTVPFAFTGLDYFGPLVVNETDKEKRWVCLFTCLTIRAIHLEVVKDLSAEECLLGIRRFIASRGLPRLIISDNATQFKLTADVLTSDYCIRNKVHWKFIPELAPWFGGFYERLIGLVKHSMKRTLDKHLINNNQLCTIIKEIEAVVNTRPLTAVGSELDHVLSPADFLRVGGSVTTETSECEFLEFATVTKTNLIDGWKRGQIILQEFRKMFNSQYLTSLRERRDRHHQPRVVVDRAPKLLETVQLRSDGSRAHWRIGKIIELIKGSDGQTRVARVKLLSGETLTRSIGHLYPLEIDDCNQNPKEQVAVGLPMNYETNIESALPAPRSADRASRASAIRAREKVKEWTSQLLSRLIQ